MNRKPESESPGRIRCIIADDEALVRERFRYAFPLEDHGFEIVGEAEDGEEALELCRRLSPDIVITDVVMPRMNGLELTAELKRVLPRIKVILLSNFQEFEFARKAVALGALGYLLKVTSGYRELLEILDTARREIEADRERMLTAIEERKHLQDSLPLLRRQLILDLLDAALPGTAQWNGTCDYVGWQRPRPFFSLGLVRIDRFRHLPQTFHPKDISLFRYVVMRMVEETTADAGGFCGVFPWGDGCIGLWFPLGGLADTLKLERFGEAVLRHANKYLPFTLSIRLGSGYETGRDPQAWSAAFRQAFAELERMQDRIFYGGHGQVHTAASEVPGSRQQENRQEPKLSMPELPDALAALEGSEDPAKLQRFIRQNYVQPLLRAKPEYSKVMTWAEELVLRWTGADRTAAERWTAAFEAVETLDELEEELLRLLAWKQDAGRLMFDDAVRRSEIRRAIDYVAEHYARPLSVAEVSGYTAISPNYFSHLFKSQTGINFSEYVTRYRIEMSKRYLAETALQVGEIAERVGIPDYKYFSRIFRRLVGMTPSRYREEQSETADRI